MQLKKLSEDSQGEKKKKLRQPEATKRISTSKQG